MHKAILKDSHKVAFIVLVVLLSLAGAWMVMLNTPFGVGMYPDSVNYIMGARNLLAGNGYSQFSGTTGLERITVWPPFYSSVLAFIGLTGMDIITAARLLNIVLMGFDLLLFIGLVFYETRRKLLSIFAGLLFLYSVPLFERYTWALTEPLYFSLLLGNIILYHQFLRTRKARWVLALGCGAAIIFLTRYAGIFMSAVWLCAILFVSTPKSRLKNSIIYLVGLIPLVVFHLLLNYLLVGSLSNRTLYFAGLPNAATKLIPGLRVLESWFTISGEGLTSHTVSLIILSLLVIAILVGAILCGIKLYKLAEITNEQPGRPAILFPLLLAILFYIAMMFFHNYFYDPTFLMDNRILSPLWFFGLYLFVLVADLIAQKGRIQHIAIHACLLALLAFSVVKFQKVSESLRSDGQGFFAQAWRDLASIEYIRQTKHSLIYSDEPLVVYILTGRVTYQIPYTLIDEDRTHEENYQHYDFMRARLLESNGILVLFDSQCSDLSDEWIQVLTRDLHLIEKIAGTCVYAP